MKDDDATCGLFFPLFSFLSFEKFENSHPSLFLLCSPQNHRAQGCSEANTEPVWRCRGHSVCSPSATTQHVLYGWAKDAPPAGVPEGAAFRVGHGTGTTSLVMQVHFSTRRPPGDKSGVRLHLGAGGGGPDQRAEHLHGDGDREQLESDLDGQRDGEPALLGELHL